MNVLVNVNRAAMMGLAAAGDCAAGVAAAAAVTQVEPFVPHASLAFGDENSVDPGREQRRQGRKYNVNALAADNLTLDCTTNPIWVQYLVGQLWPGAACVQPQRAAEPDQPQLRPARSAGHGRGSAGHPAPGLQQLLETDLVTVLAGANDILAQYGQYPTISETAARANLEAAAEQLAAQVNRIANAGGRVLIATVPDLGLSPYAIAQKAANTDTDRAALLSRLTSYFNVRLRREILNDGTRIGLLLADELRAGGGEVPGHLWPDERHFAAVRHGAGRHRRPVHLADPGQRWHPPAPTSGPTTAGSGRPATCASARPPRAAPPTTRSRARPRRPARVFTAAPARQARLYCSRQSERPFVSDRLRGSHEKSSQVGAAGPGGAAAGSVRRRWR